MRWRSIAAAMACVLVACGPMAPFEARPSVNLSAGVAHQMTPAEVEEVVLGQIARDTDRAQLVRTMPARVLKITLLAPRQNYPFPGGSFVNETVTWAVEFEGVALSCGSTCTAFTAGTWIVDDATRDITGGEFGGEVPCPAC